MAKPAPPVATLATAKPSAAIEKPAPKKPALKKTKFVQNAGFKAGLKVRREVLGAAYVDNSLANADAFSADWQQFVTEHAWGAVWTRDGLSLKTRSFLNLAMLTALNRPTELKLHIRGAINNGVTRDELKEVFLQAAVYCGAPAGLDAFKVAQQVFAEDDAAKG